MHVPIRCVCCRWSKLFVSPSSTGVSEFRNIILVPIGLSQQSISTIMCIVYFRLCLYYIDRQHVSYVFKNIEYNN